MSREVLLIAHTGRANARETARTLSADLLAAGVGVRVLAEEAADLQVPQASVMAGGHAADGAELVVVVGGDGTLLRGAELARPTDTPLLGVNSGRVGFLAEAEADALDATAQHILACDYWVEERMTLDVTARREHGVLCEGWAINDASVEKVDRARMLEIVAEIDGRPLSRWGCDGVVCATPTGSTAYAFSAGGPVVWPEVEALLLVPISAHALFARPLVTAPTSVLALEVSDHGADAVMWCDGRRSVDLPAGARIEVRRGRRPVRLVRFSRRPFTDRLVAKFALPVQGWRGGPG